MTLAGIEENRIREIIAEEVAKALPALAPLVAEIILAKQGEKSDD